MPADQSVAPTQGAKTIIVVSDHEGLGRAVEINLACLDGVQVLGLIVGDSGVQRTHGDGGGDWDRARQAAQSSDLLVVAKGSPWDGPLVAMARVGLLDCVGRVPLLIISDGPYRSVPEIQISHLDYPFEAGELHRTVLELLGMPAVAPEASG